MVLDAFSALKAVCPDALLLLAPRHTVRTSKILSLPILKQWRVILYSQLSRLSPESDLLIIDTMGSLGGLSGYADLVFVGGSLIPRGGHNPLEAASWGVPIIVGPHVRNFENIYRQLFIAQGAIKVEREGLTQQVMTLLGTDAGRQDAAEMGARAKAYQVSERGALDCLLKLLEPILS